MFGFWGKHSQRSDCHREGEEPHVQVRDERGDFILCTTPTHTLHPPTNDRILSHEPGSPPTRSCGDQDEGSSYQRGTCSGRSLHTENVSTNREEGTMSEFPLAACSPQPPLQRLPLNTSQPQRRGCVPAAGVNYSNYTCSFFALVPFVPSFLPAHLQI